MQVTKHIHALKIPFQVRVSPDIAVDRFVYVYLIYGKDICLIDTGVASSEIPIFDYLRTTGRSPDEISITVLTHSHPDHIGAVQAIKRTSGCMVAAHPGEKSWIEDVELQYSERSVPGFHSLVAGSVEVDRILEDGDLLDLGDDLSLEVIHTPGHSKGSISLFLREDGALFAGDAVPIAGDIPIYEDVLASVRSIKKLKEIDEINILLSSWDDPREGKRVSLLIDEALGYLQRIHETVTGLAGDDFSLEPMDLCRQVLGKLGLPEFVANPLVAKSFAANLKIRDQQDLLKD